MYVAIVLVGMTLLEPVTQHVARIVVTGQTGVMSMVHIAGNVALDFVGTVAERGTRDEEGLDSAATLGRWYVEAGLVDRAPQVDQSGLDRARELREHLFQVVSALLGNAPIPERSRLALNRAASQQGPITTVDPNGRLLRRGDAAACLAAVAQAGVELVHPADGAVLKLCADDLCTHPFLDRSRAKARRWCDMETCGDRAKVRRYRRTRKEALG
jgi:predicted RNA-binding Zn ribbon-like protein